MPKQINRIICAVRGFHRDELCRVFYWHDIAVREHTHQCEECGMQTVAEISVIEPTYKIAIETVMGLTPEQQTDYMA